MNEEKTNWKFRLFNRIELREHVPWRMGKDDAFAYLIKITAIFFPPLSSRINVWIFWAESKKKTMNMSFAMRRDWLYKYLNFCAIFGFYFIITRCFGRCFVSPLSFFFVLMPSFPPPKIAFICFAFKQAYEYNRQTRHSNNNNNTNRNNEKKKHKWIKMHNLNCLFIQHVVGVKRKIYSVITGSTI